jgi:hypothetical protein
MKEKLKLFYQIYKPLLKGLIAFFGFVAIFEWVIGPGLSSANTVINILTFVFAGVVSTILGVLLWDEITPKDKDDNDSDDWGGLTNEELVGDDEISVIQPIKEKEDGKI